jgi:glutaminase
VAREPSGSAFNSIVQLDTEHGIPCNSFINVGAIVAADVLPRQHEARAAIGPLLRSCATSGLEATGAGHGLVGV